MKITLQKTLGAAMACDILAVCAFSIKPKKSKPATKAKAASFDESKIIKELDKLVKGHLMESAKGEGFSGEQAQSFVMQTLGQTPAKAIALIGMGLADEQSVDGFRKSGGEAYKLAQKKRCQKLVYLVPEETTIPLFDVVQALAEGAMLARYSFDRYRTQNKNENYVTSMEIQLPCEPESAHKSALKHAEFIVHGVCLARDLVNEGPMDCKPEHLAKHAKKSALDCELAIKILDEKELKKENMGLMLAVASAAQDFSPPRLIRLHYKPKKSVAGKIALLGKGVTFDSGGLDIKTADGMLDMKVDMSGAAAVLGAMCAIGKIKPNVEVVGYLVCVENGIGSRSYHPGDVIIAKNGLTVEINNTDAEGRLILADAITYTLEHDKPDTIIDIATLTGACMVALGLKTAGIFSNDDALAQRICDIGQSVGESYWRLPLSPCLKEGLKSDVADMRNSGERWGGAITGALFLEEFVGKDVRWAHLDIAGPATNAKPHAYLPKGGVGFSVRTLVSFILGQN